MTPHEQALTICEALTPAPEFEGGGWSRVRGSWLEARGYYAEMRAGGGFSAAAILDRLVAWIRWPGVLAPFPETTSGPSSSPCRHYTWRRTWRSGCYHDQCRDCGAIRYQRALRYQHNHEGADWRYSCSECQRINLIGQKLPGPMRWMETIVSAPVPRHPLDAILSSACDRLAMIAATGSKCRGRGEVKQAALQPIVDPHGPPPEAMLSPEPLRAKCPPTEIDWSGVLVVMDWLAENGAWNLVHEWRDQGATNPPQELALYLGIDPGAADQEVWPQRLSMRDIAKLREEEQLERVDGPSNDFAKLRFIEDGVPWTGST